MSDDADQLPPISCYDIVNDLVGVGLWTPHPLPSLTSHSHSHAATVAEAAAPGVVSSTTRGPAVVDTLHDLRRLSQARDNDLVNRRSVHNEGASGMKYRYTFNQYFTSFVKVI